MFPKKTISKLCHDNVLVGISDSHHRSNKFENLSVV